MSSDEQFMINKEKETYKENDEAKKEVIQDNQIPTMVLQQRYKNMCKLKTQVMPINYR